MAWLNAHMEEMSVPHILALLRLSHWDPSEALVFVVEACQLDPAFEPALLVRCKLDPNM